MRARKPPLAALAEAQRLERAAAALSRLERQVLVLSAGQHLCNRDIAERLRISERRAERLLGRALRKFDRAMNGRQSRWRRFWSR